MTLSENLKRIRETQNLSQRQLAKRLGVANTSYFAWEQGTSKPKQANLDKLAQVLHVTRDVLLKDQSSDLLHAFNQLTDDRKENVLVYTENQLVAQKQDNSEKVRQLFP